MTDARTPVSTPTRPDARLVSVHAERGDPHERLSSALAALEGADWGLLLGGEAALARQLATLLGGGTLRVDGRLNVARDLLAEAGLAVASLDADWQGARAVWLLEPDARALDRARRAGVRVIVDGTLAPGGGWPERGADYVVYRNGVTLTGHEGGGLAALFGRGAAPTPAAPAPADVTVALALRDVATLPLRLARAARTTGQLAERLGGTALSAGPTALLLAPDAAANTLHPPGGVLAATRSVPDGVLLTPGLQEPEAALALLRGQPQPHSTAAPAALPEAADQTPQGTDHSAADTSAERPEFGGRRPRREEPRRDEQRRGRFERQERRPEGQRTESPRTESFRPEITRGEQPNRPRPDQPRADQPRPDQARTDRPQGARFTSATPSTPDTAPVRFTFDAPDADTEQDDRLPQTVVDPMTQGNQGSAPVAPPSTLPAGRSNTSQRPAAASAPAFPVPAPAQDETWEPEIVFSDTPTRADLPAAVHRQNEEGREAREQVQPLPAHLAPSEDIEDSPAHPEDVAAPAEVQEPEAEATADTEHEDAPEPAAEAPQAGSAPAPLILAPDLPPTPTERPSGPEGTRPDPAADLTDEQAAIYARLREWRNAEAKRQEISRFIIASNATIAEIARRVPYTLADLRAVRGMGPERLRKYGEKILDVVRG